MLPTNYLIDGGTIGLIAIIAVLVIGIIIVIKSIVIVNIFIVKAFNFVKRITHIVR